MNHHQSVLRTKEDERLIKDELIANNRSQIGSIQHICGIKQSLAADHGKWRDCVYILCSIPQGMLDGNCLVNYKVPSKTIDGEFMENVLKFLTRLDRKLKERLK